MLKLGIPIELYKLAVKSTEAQKTAIYAIVNLLEVAGDVDIAHLVTTGVLDILVFSLKTDHDSSVLLRALTGIEQILKKAYC